MDHDDNDCIEKVLNGQPLAFELLVGRYQARLVAFLWNLLGSGEDARDAAQEVFIKAYANLERFDRSRRFKPWLFAIAYHIGVDLLRRKRSLFNFWRNETAGLRHKPAFSHTVPLEQSPLWQPLLAKITAQERSVLALKYNEDLEVSEIATALACSPSTVRVHLLNARRKLKKELQAAGFAAGLKRAKTEEAP